MDKRFGFYASIFLITLFGYLGYVLLQKEQTVVPAPATAMVDAPASSKTAPTVETIATQQTEQSQAVEKGMTVTIADMRMLQEGDPMRFYVPQENINYEGLIDEVIISEAGSKSLTGMFQADGAGYRFVFTLGDQYTFGTLHTPEGRYQLESVAGQGRLVSTAEINASRDFTIPDYQIPDPKKPLGP